MLNFFSIGGTWQYRLIGCLRSSIAWGGYYSIGDSPRGREIDVALKLRFLTAPILSWTVGGRASRGYVHNFNYFQQTKTFITIKREMA